MSLKPQNLIQAAEADLKRRAFNAHDSGRPNIRYEPYAFHRGHVRRSTTAKQLLIFALMHPPLRALRYDDGSIYSVRLDTAKKNTRLIYADPQLILAALRILEQDDG